jgi:4,5-dihydroxyphthalate decarboxylase
MLEEGEIDAIISASVPACFTRGAPHVGRLFPNGAAEGDYFRRTGIFPILHIIGIREELLKLDPDLAKNLFQAFLAAKDLAPTSALESAPGHSVQSAEKPQASRGTRPGIEEAYSYGLGERDCQTLNLFLDYHFRQGLSDRRLEVADLFAPVPTSVYKE